MCGMKGCLWIWGHLILMCEMRAPCDESPMLDKPCVLIPCDESPMLDRPYVLIPCEGEPHVGKTLCDNSM